MNACRLGNPVDRPTLANRHHEFNSCVGRTELREFRRSLKTMPELAELGPAYDSPIVLVFAQHQNLRFVLVSKKWLCPQLKLQPKTPTTESEECAQ